MASLFVFVLFRLVGRCFGPTKSTEYPEWKDKIVESADECKIVMININLYKLKEAIIIYYIYKLFIIIIRILNYKYYFCFF